MLIFLGFFTSKKTFFFSALSENYALTSRTNIAEKGMTILNLSETFRLLWSHSYVFAIEKKPKKC